MKIVQTLKGNIGERISVIQKIGSSYINYHGKLINANETGFRMSTNTGYTETINISFDFDEPSFYHSERRIEIGNHSFDLLKLFGKTSKLKVA